MNVFLAERVLPVVGSQRRLLSVCSLPGTAEPTPCTALGQDYWPHIYRRGKLAQGYELDPQTFAEARWMEMRKGEIAQAWMWAAYGDLQG